MLAVAAVVVIVKDLGLPRTEVKLRQLLHISERKQLMLVKEIAVAVVVVVASVVVVAVVVVVGSSSGSGNL